MEFFAYAVLVVVLTAMTVYICAKITERAMSTSHDAWKHAAHAQDDCWERMIHERKRYQDQIAMLVETNAELTARVVDASKQHLNVDVIRKDILNQVRAATLEVRLNENLYGRDKGNGGRPPSSGEVHVVPLTSAKD